MLRDRILEYSRADLSVSLRILISCQVKMSVEYFKVPGAKLGFQVGASSTPCSAAEAKQAVSRMTNKDALAWASHAELDDGQLARNNPESSINQKLVGKGFARTNIPPVIAPPMYSSDAWAANNLVVETGINRATSTDLYLSGYQVTTCCGNLPPGTEMKPIMNADNMLSPGPNTAFQSGTRGSSANSQYTGAIGSVIAKPSHPYQQFIDRAESSMNSGPGSMLSVDNSGSVSGSVDHRNPGNHFSSSTGRQLDIGAGGTAHVNDSSGNPAAKDVVERWHPADDQRTVLRDINQYNYQNQRAADAAADEGMFNSGQQEVKMHSDAPIKFNYEPGDLIVRPPEQGEMNLQCGYDPTQPGYSGLPSNLAVGDCEKDPIMRKYNTNLFTQTVEPGTNTISQVNEPVNSNIGISFQQQFLPTTVQTDEKTGAALFTEHDPRVIEPVEATGNYSVVSGPDTANVTDPRFSGYGTSYRAYTDDLLGQTKFYYDDVDAIRRPNYITRSKIDFLPFADSYGPLPPGEEQGNNLNPIIRTLANDAFSRDAINHRQDMQVRLMRKNNAIRWQTRKFPKTGNLQR